MTIRYLNTIANLSRRELRNFEDWAWLQNRPLTIDSLEDWVLARANGDW
jgi:hypothetical protein